MKQRHREGDKGWGGAEEPAECRLDAPSAGDWGGGPGGKRRLRLSVWASALSPCPFKSSLTTVPSYSAVSFVCLFVCFCPYKWASSVSGILSYT